MFSVGDRVYVLFHDSVERTCLSRERPADYDSDDESAEYDACAGTVVCVNGLPTHGAMCKVENNAVKDIEFFGADVQASMSRSKVEWRQRAATSQMLYCAHLDEPFESNHTDAIHFTRTPYCPVHARQPALCPAHGSPGSAWLFQCIFTIPM